MRTFLCYLAETSAAHIILEHLNAAGRIAADHVHGEDGRITLVLSEEEIAVLEAEGLKVERGTEMLTRAERNDTGDNGGGLTDDITSGFVTGYLDALEVDAQISAIAAAHPAFCSVITLPFATSGYDGSYAPALGSATVRALRITADPSSRSRPGFLLVCGTHAREWMNPLIGLEFAQQILNNIDLGSSDPEVMLTTRLATEGDIIIVPVMNPDGLNYSIHDNAGWRKNRRANAGSPACPGVDNNRNFDMYFGGPGSSGAPCDQTYRGPAAFSEPETRNIRYLLEDFPNILVAVDSHSYGNAVFRPQPSGGSFIASLPVSAEDHAIYTSLENVFVNAVSAAGGPVYSTGTTSNHAGASDDYMFFGHRIFAFDTECGTEFQPPWTEAQLIIAQVTAGLRALAGATLDLTTTTTAPLSAVQAIDATGSMVAFGYVTSARENAKRFIDLMSLGDSAGTVSFADPASDPAATPEANRSQTVFPLTPLNDPGDATAARAAIDGISFGGWTPIGAGLKRARDLLSGAAQPRGILLLSDGFENRDPLVSSVLATWPANLPVYTIALGASADNGLLADIASQTGGQFQISPSALDLHLIYNQMRADMSDADTVINTAQEGGIDSERPFSIQVETGAETLEISVSSEGAAPARLMLYAPGGREVRFHDHGVRFVRRGRYSLITVNRPARGVWTLTVGGAREAYVAAAFVRSPLRLRIGAFKNEPRFSPQVNAFFGEKELTAPVIRARSVKQVLQRPDLTAETLRIAPELKPSSAVPLRANISPLTRLTRPQITAALKPVAANALTPALFWPPEGAALPKGASRVTLEIQGTLPGGEPYQRTVIRTALV